jgi:hypothetical protein
VSRAGRVLSDDLYPIALGRENGSGYTLTRTHIGSCDFSLAESTMKYLVFPQPKPDYDFRTFDFDSDISQLDRWGKLANANDPDLSGFKKRGGKRRGRSPRPRATRRHKSRS